MVRKIRPTFSDEEIREMINNPTLYSGDVLIKRAEEAKIFSEEDETTGLISPNETHRILLYFLVFTIMVFTGLVVLYHFGYGISLYGWFRGGK